MLLCSPHSSYSLEIQLIVDTTAPSNYHMSTQRRSNRKKRQTQLSFTPLPSSSPAASQYPEQVQRRAASVRYENTLMSPTKKRRIGGFEPKGSPPSQASSNGGSPFGSQRFQVVIPSPSKSPNHLPTPAASSQVELDKDSGSYFLGYKFDQLLIFGCIFSFGNRQGNSVAY